jgi:hypothetical protein
MRQKGIVIKKRSTTPHIDTKLLFAEISPGIIILMETIMSITATLQK